MADVKEKITTFLTGKNKIEREQEKSASKEIRKKVLAAGYQEKQKQAVRIAIEKERLAGEKKVKQLRRAPMSGGFFQGAREYWGVPQRQPQRQLQRVKTITIVKGKHGKKRRRVSYSNPQPQKPQPRYTDFLGIAGGKGQQGRKVDVLGWG